MKTNSWWKQAFATGNYPLVVLAEDPAKRRQARDDVSFILEKTKLKKKARILDLACGVGRHSLPLARKGFEVTGVDISPVYLRSAKKYARQGRLKIRFVRGDMRKIPFRSEFDAVINMWTSFGYFKSPAEDLSVLKGIHRALKPGGYLFLDIVNGDLTLHRALKNHWVEIPGGYVLEEIIYDKPRRITHSHWIFILGNKKREMRSAIRVYSSALISKFLKKAGFDVVKIWGDVRGAPYKKFKSSRLAVLARKR